MSRNPTETPVSMENLRATIKAQDTKNDGKFLTHVDFPDMDYATNEDIRKALFNRGGNNG